MGSVRVLTICGSLRSVSSNAEVLKATAVLAPAHWHVTAYEEIGALPHFNPDLDVEPPHPAVGRLRSAVAQADALVLSTPEYAHGLPGSFKNALDWLVSGMEVYEKPCALLNASEHSLHGPASLREILSTMSVQLPPHASVTVPLNGRKLDAAAIAADPSLAAELRRAIEALDQAVILRRTTPPQ